MAKHSVLDHLKEWLRTRGWSIYEDRGVYIGSDIVIDFDHVYEDKYVDGTSYRYYKEKKLEFIYHEWTKSMQIQFSERKHFHKWIRLPDSNKFNSIPIPKWSKWKESNSIYIPVIDFIKISDLLTEHLKDRQNIDIKGSKRVPSKLMAHRYSGSSSFLRYTGGYNCLLSKYFKDDFSKECIKEEWND